MNADDRFVLVQGVVLRLPADIKIGDKVRSYDFEGRKDCYVEGVVCAIEPLEGCDRYVITTVNRVFAGEPVYRSGELVYTPVNGTRFAGSDRVTNFVEKIADFS